MKRYFAMLLFLLLLPMMNLYGQMSLQLEFQKRVFLQYEPIIAKVAIRNDSGQTLVFGKDERLRGALKFEIIGRDKRILDEISDTHKILEGVILKPGESQEIFVYLNRFYPLVTPSRYDIRCYITHPMLKKDYESNQKYLEVSSGVPEWTRKVGLPAYMIDGENPEQEKARMYSIISLMNNGRKNLYLLIEDSKFVHKVRSICVVMGQEDFLAEVDNLGRLHVFVPVAPQEFKYVVITLDGDVDVDTMYRSAGTIPVMARDPKSGRVYIVGGTEVAVDEQKK